MVAAIAAQAASQPVTVIPKSKFMENFRVASPVNAGSEVLTACNAQGDVELFTVGTDGTLWNFHPDPSSDTGFSASALGLKGSVAAVGVDNGGSIIVFAAEGTSLSYVREVNQPGARWSAPVPVDVPVGAGAIRIARIITGQIGGLLYVGVLTQTRSILSGQSYTFSYAVWSTSNNALTRTNLVVSTLNCAWTGSSASTATFTVADSVLLQYGVADGVTRTPTVASTFKTLDLDADMDAAGNPVVLGILSDGNAYKLVGGSQGIPYNWQQLSINKSFKEVRTTADAAGRVHAFAVATDGRLYHLAPSDTSPSGFLQPAPIHTQVAAIGVTFGDSGAIDLFAVGTQQNTVTHLFLEEASSAWADEQVEVQAGGQVESYSSFGTDLTFHDAAGAPLVNTPVMLWASEEARLTVNGSVYFVNANRPVRVSTNSAGMVAVSQETKSLGIPTLLVSVPSLMSPGDSIAVVQNTGVKDQLGALTGQGLLDATTASGSQVLQGSYRTPDTADAVAKAVSQCMSTSKAVQGASDSRRYLHARRAQPGAFHFRGDASALRCLDTASLPEQHWHLSFQGGKATYRNLAPHEAQALITTYHANLTSSLGVFDWLEDVGDFIEGVGQGIVDIVDTVVTTVADGIQAAITFVVDGVSYVFHTVVGFVEEMVALAETVFAQVKIFFEQLYEWLALLFQWGDILRTHEAVAHTVNQLLGFLQGAAGGIQRLVDSGIDNLQARVADVFERAIRDIAGTQTLGGFESANAQSSPEFEDATSNNVVYNGFVDNAGGGTRSLHAMLRAPAVAGPIGDFVQKLQSLADFTKASGAFSRAATYFTNLGGSPDQVFQQALAGLMSVAEGILQAVLSGAKAVVDALLQLASSVISSFQQVLNEDWDIPFVSQLYSFITDGASLTTLDLVALIVAIPMTLLYKLANGAAPFPDGASVDQFKASVTAQKLLAATGLGGGKLAAARALARARLAEEPEPWTGLVSPKMAMLMATGWSVCTFLGGWLNAVCDAFPPGTEPPGPLSTAAFIMNTAGQALSCPWFISSGGIDCTTADGANRLTWVFTNLGVLNDVVGMVAGEALKDDVKSIITHVYGDVHLILAIIASVGQDGLTVANNILPCFPEMGKLLRHSSVVGATGGISLAVIAALDALVGTSASVIGFVVMERDIHSTSTAASHLSLATATAV
jgi:hypothetical protein